MDIGTGVDEFKNIKLTLKEFSEGKFKVLEEIRTIQHEIKVVQQRSFRLRKELQEGRTRYQDFISHCDRLRTRLLELSIYQLEIPSLQSRYRDLTAVLHAKNQESNKQMDRLRLDLAIQRNDSTTEHTRKIEEKRKQLERELSDIRSDLANAMNGSTALQVQELEHNQELERLRAEIAMEMEQEKETTAHNNCQSKVRGLKTQINELEAKIDRLRSGI